MKNCISSSVSAISSARSLVKRPIRCLLLGVFALAASSSANAAALIIDITEDVPNGSPGVLYNGATGSAGLTGTWGQTNGSTFGYGPSKEHFNLSDGSATWIFTGLPLGNYSVYTFYSATGNRSTAAPYTTYDGSVATGIDLGTVAINQELAPDDLTIDDGQGTFTWEVLQTEITITSGTLTVVLGTVPNSGNDFVIADAIRIESVVPEPSAAFLMGLAGVAVLLRRRRR